LYGQTLHTCLPCPKRRNLRASPVVAQGPVPCDRPQADNGLANSRFTFGSSYLPERVIHRCSLTYLKERRAPPFCDASPGLAAQDSRALAPSSAH
jgi:hypothetical protein